jgi:hypothetical protein
MTINKFNKEEDKSLYLEWRKKNPQGYVLNINTMNPRSTATINIIHSAYSCPSLDSPPTLNRDRPVTPEHPKLCSINLNELKAEMEATELPYKICGLCLRKK